MTENIEGLKVKCPKCKRTGTYITTEKYNPDIAPNGSMVKLRNSKHKGGLTFGSAKGSPNIKACFMECCDCGGLLTFGGKLIVIPEDNLGDSIITGLQEIIEHKQGKIEMPDIDEADEEEYRKRLMDSIVDGRDIDKIINSIEEPKTKRVKK